MKFWEIFRFEFAYQVRRIWFWLICIALLVISFLMTRDNSLAEALYEDFFLNSPFGIAKTTVAGSLIWLMGAAVIAGEAAARDVATRMHPLIYTASVTKTQYLGGRFLAALTINALTLLVVQAGIILAVYLPGVDPQLVGPFRPAAFITAYGYIALPNALVATAIQFAMAAWSGKPMAAYLGSLLLFFMSYIVAIFLLFQGRQDIANLLDSIGVHFILSELSHLWTPIEKRWRLIGLEGTVLTNRMLWVGIALMVIAITYLRFRFTHRTEGSWWWWLPFKVKRKEVKSPVPEGIGVTVSAPVSMPMPARSKQALSFGTRMYQMLAIAWTSFRALATSWAGLFLLVAVPLMSIPVIIDQMEMNGVPLLPMTGRVLSELTAPLSAEMSRWIIVPLIIIFFVGELVWREREAGLGEITDAMPGSEWTPFLGKFFGLGLILVTFLAFLMAAGILAQVLMGYNNFQPGLYLKVLFGLQLTEYLLFALLALVVHVLVDQKYLGHLVAVLAFIFIILAPLFGVEHNLLVYGAGPGWSYTDMSGFGPSIGPWLWFKLYWTAWALLLAVIARLLWVRGKEKGFGLRLRLVRHRFTRSTILITAIALVMIISAGGFIFYNTNVLNKYHTATEIKELGAKYEQRYGQYKAIAQPRLTATNLHIEIYPKRRELEIRGSYRLINRNAKAIDTILVATVPGVETGAITFDRTATQIVTDEDHGQRIYTLKEPLQPGDTMRLTFTVSVKPHGFHENGISAAIVENGTYFTNRDVLPSIGYQSGRELIRPADRREYGLPPRSLIASLYDKEAPKQRGEMIDFEATIGTDEGQTAVAPGILRQTWPTDSGKRRYFRYSTDEPIGAEQFFFCAKYTMREAKWNSVTIRIYHDPRHTANIDRMIRSVQASLDYYSKQFGPYKHNQVVFVEHPGDGDGAGIHAVPGMLIVEEGFSFWDPGSGPGNLDHPYAVVAHEMAHQWTVPYANVEGAPVMSESIAWYYAMKAVEHSNGNEQLWLLRSFMRHPHPHAPIRRGEPLLRGLDPYLSYRRGPFALYALSEYIGDDRVNSALRNLLEKHRQQEAPLATTLDLYRELQAVTPDSLKYLLHDLFEVNTYWELQTQQATAKQTRQGTWQVTFDVRARKKVSDVAGMQSEVPMNEWIEIGIFDLAEQGRSLYLQKHRIRSGKQTLTVTIPHKPARISIDPNYLLIDLNTDDNISEVKIGQ